MQCQVILWFLGKIIWQLLADDHHGKNLPGKWVANAITINSGIIQQKQESPVRISAEASFRISQNASVIDVNDRF
jgi:hypothetical protein